MPAAGACAAAGMVVFTVSLAPSTDLLVGERAGSAARA
jgi:hypothetical protein